MKSNMKRTPWTPSQTSAFPLWPNSFILLGLLSLPTSNFCSLAAKTLHCVYRLTANSTCRLLSFWQETEYSWFSELMYDNEAHERAKNVSWNAAQTKKRPRCCSSANLQTLIIHSLRFPGLRTSCGGKQWQRIVQTRVTSRSVHPFMTVLRAHFRVLDLL